MSGKQVAPPDVFRTAVTPVVSSVSEAIQRFAPAGGLAAPAGGKGVWGRIKRTAKKVKSKFTGHGDVEEGGAPEEEAPEQAQVGPPGVQQGPPPPDDTPPPPTLTQQVEGGIQGLIAQGQEMVDGAIAFVEQEPHVRLAHLYAQLGATDPLLRAIYPDAELRRAALSLGADRLVAFLAHDTLSDAAVQEAPAAFAGQLDAALAGLPVGKGMSVEIRRGLRRLVPALSVEQAMAAFGARFGHAMRNDGGSWTMDLILAVWDQLAVLPDQDVTDMTVLTTYNAIAGGGGYGPSWEAPDVVNTIQLGEDNDPAALGHTVRHEVGHAVHAEMPAGINAWLQSDIGFWFYEIDDGGLRTTINELGGFPAKLTLNGVEEDFGDDAQAWALHLLRTFVGGGSSWTPSRNTVTEGQDPSLVALWDAMPAGVQDLATQSPAHWYTNYANFAQGTKGQYFLNYWYSRVFYMSATAKAVVDASGDDYTAMSEKEFFANAYAEYFEDPAGYNDHSLWGGSLPNSVKDFFASHIVERQPYVAPNPQVEQNVEQGGGAAPPSPTGMAGTP